MGSVKARWQIGRMHYKVDPGLYALGNPDGSSPVLVTANYKMSFDRLRSALPKTDGWILVLDTNGINVWCAAGKGTFGTEELAFRVVSSGLDRVVSHRQLILPQLAGPGVAAHEVKKRCGFGVVYGPIRAEDIPAFLENGLKATAGMRVKTFNTWERFVLIPVELVDALKAGLLVLPALFLLGGLGRTCGLLVQRLQLWDLCSLCRPLGHPGWCGPDTASFAMGAGTRLFGQGIPAGPGDGCDPRIASFASGRITAGVA